MKTEMRLAVLLLLIASTAFGQVSLLDPQPSTPLQDSLVRSGVALHDQGKYDEAIAIYREALAENPSNTEALFEISYSCFTKNDLDEALRWATEGTRYHSKHLPLFYLNIGNVLDNQGKPDEAIEAFNKGIILDPANHLLRYNLGLAYYRRNNIDSARICFQNAVRIDPAHASSHQALAAVYNEMGKTVPRVFALGRFLLLEPNSKRSKPVLDALDHELEKSVKAGEGDAGQVTVNVPHDSDGVDGDLGVLEMGLAMTWVSRRVEKDTPRTDIQWRAHGFQTFFRMMLEVSEKESLTGFCWKYYAPYYIEMERQGLTEAFVYLISRSSEDKEVMGWLRANQEKVGELLTWSKGFSWSH
jgi:tetratricopeptide (TPR) repeat protein